MKKVAFWKSVLTDRLGEFDTGRILVPIVILAMLAFTYIDVAINKQPFSAQNLGTGVGLVLTAFAAYLWGDYKASHPAG